MLNAEDVVLPHEEDPEYLSEMARAGAADALRARLKFCRLHESLPLDEPTRKRADHLERLAAQDDRREAEMLRRLNAFFLAAGHPPGNEVVIRGEVYRAATAGNPAVYLGAELPRDDSWSDRDQLAEDMASYARLSHI